MNAKDFLEAGQLTEAIQAATDDVKASPTSVEARDVLCQLLCFAGDLDRADLQLDTIGKQSPEAMIGVALVRQLIRAEKARQQFYSEGRVPEFLEEPTPVLQKQLEASICIREGQFDEAAALFEQAEAERVHVSGVLDGVEIEDLRDADDRTASFLEVLTSNGKYYWIPFEKIELVEFHEPEQLLELLWRRVRMIVRGGPDGEVFLPALYPGTYTDEDDKLRLGLATDWRGEETAVVRGAGQRILIAGDDGRPLLELQELTIAEPNVTS